MRKLALYIASHVISAILLVMLVEIRERLWHRLPSMTSFPSFGRRHP